MHQALLLAALPQLQDLLCDLCTSGHTDLVVILPGHSVLEVEEARDNLYLLGDPAKLAEIFQIELKSFQLTSDIEKLKGSQQLGLRKGHGGTDSRDALGSNEDLANEKVAEEVHTYENVQAFSEKEQNEKSRVRKVLKAGSRTKLSCKECPFKSKYKKILRNHTLNVHKLKQFATLSSRKCDVEAEDETKPSLDLENDDPGADFEILFEESFLGSTRGGSLEAVSNTFEDSGVKSISDVESLCNNPKSLESLRGPGFSDLQFEPFGTGGRTRDSGITDMGDIVQSPADWKKHASPMVYDCYQCDYKSFTRIMLNRHRQEMHRDSMNRRRLTIANAEDLKTLSCQSCTFSTRWKQTLELHMINNHDDFRPSSKKQKKVFESPLVRTLSVRTKSKIAKAHLDANFLKTCFSPEQNRLRKRKKDDKAYGCAEAFVCQHCDFKTFLQTTLTKHIEAEHHKT